MSVTQQLAGIATNLISTLGYGGLALGLVVDSAGVPIPSEVLLPLAGALARGGRFNLVAVIIVGTLAQVLGAVISYVIGDKGGLPLVRRYGKYVLFRERELQKTQELFARYGIGLTFAGRCMPGIRTYIGYPAGLAKMRFDVFLLASTAGSLIWTVLLAVLGYELADKLDVIDKFIGKFGLITLAVLIIVFIAYLKRERKH